MMVVVGYFCVVQYAASPTEPSPRGIIHAVAAIAIFFVLAVKLAAIRRYGKLYDKLMTYGQLLYFSIVVTVALSAGYYFLTTATKNADAVVAMVGPKDNYYSSGYGATSPATGEALTKVKCARCHTLERIYNSRKSSDGWASTVSRMKGRAPSGWMSDLETLRITAFLARARGPAEATKKAVATMARVSAGRAGDVGKGKELFNKRCHFCHSADSKETKVGPGFKELFRRGALPFSGKPANLKNIEAQLRKPARLMPPFKDLTDEDVQNLVAYLSTL